jgi:environmental stress-induced protein Ves
MKEREERREKGSRVWKRVWRNGGKKTKEICC